LIKTYLFLILAIAVFDYSNARLDHCPAARRKEVDKCSRDVFFLMDPEFQPPTEKSMVGYCEKMDKDIKCIEKYGKECLKGFTKQSLTIASSGFKKLYKKICGPKATKKDEFIKRSQWMTNDDREEIYTCAAGSIKNYNYINDKVDNDDQIQQGCCVYWIARQCSQEKMKKLTTDDNRKFFTELTDETMTGLIKFLCTKQDSVDSCKKQMPKVVKRLETTMSAVKKGEREQEQSFLIPFLQIVSD